MGAMKVLRTAVVGLGRVGWRFHIPQVLEHDGFELAAVVDPLPDRLAEAESKFGVRGYRDHEALLEAEQLDLVVIASPTRFHCAQAVAAFERGCDVFCDKPMSFSLEEADRMIVAMETHGRKLMVYQPHRAVVEVVALQEILRRGLIGPVYMMKRAQSRYVRRNDWQAFRKHGGGMLNNYGAHYIDQLLYLAGSSARRITCSLRSIATLGDADDVVKAVIETENGVILDLDINMAAAHPIPPWLIFGERGSIVLDEEARTWRVRFFRLDELPDVPLHEALAAPGRRYPRDEAIPWRDVTFPLADFHPVDFYARCYEFYALDAAPFVPVAESRELMRVLDVCRRDAEKDALGER